MGLLDIPALVISAILTGILGATGAVYCSAPNFIYIVGTFGIGMNMKSICIIYTFSKVSVLYPFSN